MSKPNYKIIYRYEHPVGSMIADTFTYGIIVASYWINQQFIDGNNFLDLLLLIFFFMFALAKASNIQRMVEYTRKDRELFDREDN
ncbi:hypothetical protein G3I13_01790 [Streptomyces sp. SID6673]|nr:hypothetical protein [Streptomyces sp. SID11726]NDZ94892.1 hypothetical protein [Streptomyces sp. SID11726]NEB23052.1 hypothetical protein [Streptomyces sp. SID6673]